MSAKRKTTVTLAAPVTRRSANPPTKGRIDESRTAVSKTDTQPTEDIIEISSDPESEYDDEEGEEAGGFSGADAETNDATNGVLAGSAALGLDTEMADEPVQEAEDESGSPTFGDLVRNNEAIDVSSALATQQSATATTAPTFTTPRTIAPPSLSSLGTVLNQALRTDDSDLLESCLHTSDLRTVRNTIQRMDSALAGTLLTKLAARLHRRPGRAHSLVTWVQTTLIAHGGALATQPEVVRRLAELNRVLDERARGLNSLLVLKGKLELLEGQMALRRLNRSQGPRSRRQTAPGAEEEDDEGDADEEGIVYVEGQEDEPLTNGASAARKNGAILGDEDEEDGDDDFAMSNGVVAETDESEDEDQDEVDLIDDEAVESSGDEDDVDHDDLDEEEDEEEDEESEVEAVAPPAKIRKRGASAFSKRK